MGAFRMYEDDPWLGPDYEVDPYEGESMDPDRHVELPSACRYAGYRGPIGGGDGRFKYLTRCVACGVAFFGSTEEKAVARVVAHQQGDAA